MKVGYIGLGVMGGALARRLCKSRDLQVFDLNPDTVAALTSVGATTADSPTALAETCDIVMLCLPRSSNVREAIFGPGGLSEGLKPGAVIIDQTSGDPGETRRMAKELESRHITLIDAPVSGGATGAEEGNIAIMVGASQDVFNRVLPLLESISAKVFRCGEVGAGQIMKLVNNTVSASVRCVTMEAVAMALRNGLDLGTVTEVLNSGGAASRVTERLLPAVIKGEPDSFFYLSLMLKDLNLSTQLAVECGVPLQFGETTRSLLQSAVNSLGPQANYFEITAYIAAQAGVELPGREERARPMP